MAKVELKLRCFNLPAVDFFSKSDPLVAASTKVEGQTEDKWEDVGRTECIPNNLGPVFTKTITVDWKANTLLKFDVWDMDEEKADDINKATFIGYYTVLLSELVSMGGAATGRKHLHAKNGNILANGSISLLATVQGGDAHAIKAEAAAFVEEESQRKACMLYWGSQSSGSLACLALVKSQLAKEVRLEKVDAAQAKTAHFLEHNTAGTLPFVDDAGFKINGENAILRNLCQKYPAAGAHLFPADLHARTAVEVALDWHLTYTVRSDSTFVAELERRLATQPFVAGNSATIADLAVWADAALLPEAATADTPNVKRWLKALAVYDSVLAEAK